ncbi:transposase [Sneathiella sp. HT1-7]|nr:transposase [Sneathiella sp. HT1-7]
MREKRVSRPQNYSNWKWHLDEVFVKINGETYYIRRTIDHEDEVLEVYVSKRRDRKAAIIFLKKLMKR